jgi:hypothetical protein
VQKLTGYMAGVNLGGWISQYGDKSHDHFKSFILEEDIQTIASWGMDHIRVPFDYPILEDDDNPGVYKDSGWGYLDSSLTWAKKYGLNVIFDLHEAPGFAFGKLDTNSLFTDPVMQERTTSLWRAVAERYEGEDDNVMYELLNEIVEPDSTRWNPLAQKLIKGIREVDQKHSIIVGGIRYNSVTALTEMPLFDDPKIVYNFHMYEPLCFTHQFASWNKATREFARKLAYPGDISGYREYAQHPDASIAPDFFDAYQKMDKAFIETFLQPAVDHIQKFGKPMYCGEYGVIDNVPPEERVQWHEDLSNFLLTWGIGRAVWTYKGMNFTLIDDKRQPMNEALVRAVSKY